jgi:hypothetical protein
MRLLPYTIWNQFFFLVAYFCILESFFQNSIKRKEKKRKRKNDNFDVFLEFFKKPKRNLLDLDLGRQLQQETKRRRE